MWGEEMHSTHTSPKSSKVTWQRAWTCDSNAEGGSEELGDGPNYHGAVPWTWGGGPGKAPGGGSPGLGLEGEL